MQFSTGRHCEYSHRYHVVWWTKYRFKVLQGPLRLRVREICWQVCTQYSVEIIKGVLSAHHVHMFASFLPNMAISDFVRLMKGRSSHKSQRAYFSTPNWGITEDILQQHIATPTDASR